MNSEEHSLQMLEVLLNHLRKKGPIQGLQNYFHSALDEAEKRGRDSCKQEHCPAFKAGMEKAAKMCGKYNNYDMAYPAQCALDNIEDEIRKAASDLKA